MNNIDLFPNSDCCYIDSDNEKLEEGGSLK